MSSASIIYFDHLCLCIGRWEGRQNNAFLIEGFLMPVNALQSEANLALGRALI